MAQDVHDLIVWQRAIELTTVISKLTQRFPKQKIYGLTSQMRRAAISVASNIAEGRGRLNPMEFRQFLGLAQGSLYELRTQIIVANRLGLDSSADLTITNSLCEQTLKMLISLINKLGTARKLKRAEG